MSARNRSAFAACALALCGCQILLGIDERHVAAGGAGGSSASGAGGTTSTGAAGGGGPGGTSAGGAAGHVGASGASGETGGNGGAPATGGSPATGGTTGTGGISASGGTGGSGGTSGTGGAGTTGGTGGIAATGGTGATGGIAATGGTGATGGTATGGASTGGTSGTGGVGTTGGTGGTATGGAGTGGTGGTPTCTVVAALKVSSASATSGPALAALASGPLWSIAWASSNTSILGNAIDGSDKLVNTTDRTLVPAASGTTVSPPQLTAFGTSAAVAYGQAGPQNNSAYAAVRLVDPRTGQTSGSAALGSNEGQAVLPLVGGVAATSALSSLVTGSHLTNASADSGRVTRFSSAPALATSSSPTSSTYAVAVAWSDTASRYGAAFVEAGTSAGGKLVTYDESLGSTTAFAFTATGDQPAFGAAFPASISALGGRFVVAWIDLQSSPNREVFITSVDALNGIRAPTSAVKASDTSATYKYYPRILSDGKSVIVAWVEPSTTLYRVMWRRFDASLTALGPSQCASCATNPANLSPIGLAALGPNDYGFATLLSDNNQYFTHITCTGP